ncbi:hypothetical protein [Candidatus Pelagibacter sp. Uisw_090]|uniref:hypothetical protein n=1 Tax=Candidatus Pelagibacter sp. Uisw_090 TaxID=3230993 RepID=UPI0039E9DB83
MNNINHLSDFTILENVWNYVSIFIVFFIGLFLIFFSEKIFDTTKVRVCSLYVWHTILCSIFIFTTSKIGGDAIFYYTASLIHEREFSFGTTATLYFTTIFTRGFGLTYISTFMVFNIIGTYGLLALDASLRHATFDKSKYIKLLALFTVLMPSLSYWSSGIGKDAIQFFGTCFLLWSSINFKKRNIIFLISLIIIFTTRPHIGGIAIISLFLSLWFISSLSLKKKILYLIITFVPLIFLLPTVLDSVGFSKNYDYSLANLFTFIKLRQTYTMIGGSSVDIGEMNFIYQLFTYLFRPLPYETHNTLAFLSSLDNLFLLSIFIITILSIIFVKREKFLLNHHTENRWFLLIFSLVGLSILSYTTANFGISARQKWMVMPILLYFCFQCMRVK